MFNKENDSKLFFFSRQRVAKSVLEEFRTCRPEILAPDLPEIMKILGQMSDEPILRADLLEEIPHIAAQAIECSTRVSAFKNVVSDYLIPLVVRSLGCSENTLIAHSTLINLIKQGFITKLQAEIQVCPAILALTKLETATAVDVNTGAINLMSKLAPLLGRDVTERVFLGRFTELCSSPMFYIRKVCAAHFGNFCAVVGKDAVEKVLLPQYLALCTDDVWGVRMACAEVITYMSCACSKSSKTEKLSPAFGALLQDDCRWVRVSAYQSLGLFISTFAEPPITNIGYSINGDLVLLNIDGGEFTISCSPPLTLTERYSLLGNSGKEDTNVMMNPLNFDLEENDPLAGLEEGEWSFKSEKEEIDLNSNADSNEHKSECNAKIDGDIDLLVVKNKETTEDSKCNSSVILNKTNCDISEILIELKNELQNIHLFVDSKENSTNVDSEISQLNSNNSNEDKITDMNKDTNDNEKKVNNINNNVCDTREDDLHLFYSHNYWYISPDMPLDPNIVAGDMYPIDGAGDFLLQNDNTQNKAADNNNSTLSIDEKDVADDSVVINNMTVTTEPEQTIVPQILVDSFISMTYPALPLNIEHEMAYHCAYSLPAVVLTLGKENWHLLEDTVFSLASDLQYKVRRTVASSLHELAIILGPELATNSLTSLFEGFIKDLDEVRIGVLKHLTAFLTVINPPKRNTYLPRLVEFLHTDNEWNWRFREELAKQLLEAMELFKPSDIAKHIGVIAVDLLCDKVAAVRTIALSLVTEIVSYTSSEPNLTSSLLVKLAETFAHSKKWKRRQTFCLLCIELLKEEALEPEQFMSEVMPHLLDLSWDPVANIRLVVARCISNYILKNEYFADSSNENYDGLETVLRRLQADKDSDVRQSAEV
ncbi:unnamed protein product [Psylliodes chrysocephalus]|uniref:Serine/threonine-protein phosphatase 4 regulatory subunit 1 n=1 Tax=Psylliodes chrysocephalus TaxID=3402493 RepID=A0A9P0GE65_9CUCU|nr:unnamed protein product [Psylliodes chrysocephala]